MSEHFHQTADIYFSQKPCWNLAILLASLQDFQQEKTGKP